MNRLALALTHLVILLFAGSLAARAEALRGRVTNGTTNKPSSGDEVLLKRMGNGMEDAGRTTTNAKGEFSFEVPASQMPSARGISPSLALAFGCAFQAAALVPDFSA